MAKEGSTRRQMDMTVAVSAGADDMDYFAAVVEVGVKIVVVVGVIIVKRWIFVVVVVVVVQLAAESAMEDLHGENLRGV